MENTGDYCPPTFFLSFTVTASLSLRLSFPLKCNISQTEL